MDGISYTYKVERFDTPSFHGWVIFECSEGLEEEIFSSSNIQDIKDFMHDLRA